MSHDMALQVVYIYHRNAQATGKSLGKAYTYKQRTHKTRTTCKGHSRKLFFSNASTLQGSTYNRYDVLLMSTRCKFGYYATIFEVDILRSCNIAKQYIVVEHRCACIVAAALNT